MTTPLVLLGCGYVGTAIAREAMLRGRPVHALVRSPERAQALRSLGLASVVAADVAGDIWHAALPAAGAEVVYSVSSGGGDDVAYRRAYADGMASALRWAARCGGVSTFVYTSSTGVYPQSGGETVDESSPVGGDARAEILVETESLLTSAAGTAGSGVGRAFVLRLGGLYGPGRHYLLDALRRGEARLPGRGDFRINYLHRDDAVAGVFAALCSPGSLRGGVYNLTDGHPFTKAEIVAWLAHRLGVPAPEFAPEVVSARAARRGAGSPDRVVSNAAFLRDFRVEPAYPDFRAGYAAILAAG